MAALPPGGPPGNGRTIPFSTHARGVPLFERSRFFDLPGHATLALLDLRDLSSAMFWFVSCQTWLTLWSFLIMLISVVFFSFYKEGGQRKLAAQLDWVLLCSVAVLPAVGFLLIAYLRRERALGDLARVKVLMLALYSSHRDWVPEGQRPAGHLEGVQASLAAVLHGLRAYLSPMRFYSRYYPYMGSKAAMVHIALERTRKMRRVSGGIYGLQAAATSLHGCSMPQALLPQLHNHALELQLAVERLAAVKEFRTPQGVRALSRFYLLLFLPIFFGPYWAWVANFTNFGFAFFFSILLQIAVTGLVNTTIALEDPFDNQGMDGIFLDEALYEVEQLIGGTEDSLFAESEDGTNHGARAGGMASVPSSPAATLGGAGPQGATAAAAAGLSKSVGSGAKLPAAPAPMTDTV